MDMDPSTIKAVWVLMVQKDPELFIWQRCLHAMHKGLPAFGIYGREVQDKDETSISDDVKEKLLRFGRRR